MAEEQVRQLEEAGEIALRKFHFKEAFRIYSYLAKNFPKPDYHSQLEIIRQLLPYEKFQKLSQKTNIKLEDLIKLTEQSKVRNISPEKILLDEIGINRSVLLQAIGEYYQVTALDIKDLINKRKLKISPKAFSVKSKVFEETLALPVEYEGENFIVTYFPDNTEQISKLQRILQIPVTKLAFALKEDILEMISKIEEFKLLSTTASSIEEVQEEQIQEEQEEELIDSTVVNLVNSIIEEAYKRRSSDIHFDSLPGKGGILVRLRVDGECFDYLNIPETQKRSVISRIKIMANLDIAEKRLPQDGKIKFRTKEGQIFELRVATIPTIEGNENVVMRILGGVDFKSLEELGLLPENYEKLKKILDMPYGLILCVGPTGSGKTTTLHACLKYLNRPTKKIWTAEDPVEIVQKGLCQVQVNPKIGLTFARVLRAFLRADPDIIMIGETRDSETAHTLIEASLTGHLVLSTLHTNSAPETVTRLLEMDIDPFNFADSLLGILAQRLAKRLCKCKEKYQPTLQEFDKLRIEYGNHPVKPLTDAMLNNAQYFKPRGCEICNYTGYKGRIAIHELLIPDDDLKALIVKKAPAQELRDMAIKKGMLTLKQDGILKVLMGETTLDQVLAVTIK